MTVNNRFRRPRSVDNSCGLTTSQTTVGRINISKKLFEIRLSSGAFGSNRISGPNFLIVVFILIMDLSCLVFEILPHYGQLADRRISGLNAASDKLNQSSGKYQVVRENQESVV